MLAATATQSADLSDLPDAELVAAIATHQHALTRFQARFITALAEFHHRDLAKEHGAPNTVTWLIRHHDLARRTAYDYLRTGKILRDHPVLTAEFLAARLTYSKVRLLRPYLNADNEHELVDLALSLTLEELAQALAGRPKPGAGSGGRARNTFKVVLDDDGGLHFWGSLDAEHSADFLAALKTGELANLRNLADIDPAILDDPRAMDEEIDTARQHNIREHGDTTPAGGEGDGAASPEAVTRFGTPTAAGLLSALLGMINVVRSSPRNKLRAPGAEVHVLVTTDGRVMIPEHHGAETGQLMRSILNGMVRLHLLDRDGVHLNLSRAARTVSRSQETSLLARWGYRCAAPGCPHTRFLEFHHIIEWHRGGETNLDNLIPLCSGCHALVSSGQITIHVDGINRELLRFRFPGGISFTSSARQLPVADERMGKWRDRYLDGPVPDGDEHLIQLWDTPDSFDDPHDDAGVIDVTDTR